MTSWRTRSAGRTVATVLATAGAVGLGLLAVPAGAGAAPELPPVTPQELVSSVLAAKPGPFDGTVSLDNSLGLPALPDLPQVAADGTSTARVFSGGDGKRRVQLPGEGSERDLISDGTTFWAWDSATRTVTTGSRSSADQHPDATTTDPQAAAEKILDKLGASSTVSVDGTAEVAGRPAYDLVLAPKASERTLLREVRIAIDAQTRAALQLTVLANGSTEPALQVGFTDLTYRPQDAALFTFTPPPGATVAQPPTQRPAERSSRTVGDGWDTVIVFPRPTKGGPDLGAIGTPVSGAWGSGKLVTSAVASAIVTDDGRVAAGAVPEQVLTAALGG